ncbi:hypothetical protein ACFL59_10105, partial [Planctomycetota bacterium]
MARKNTLPKGLRQIKGIYYVDLYDPHGKRSRKSLKTDDLKLAKVLMKREQEKIIRKAYDLPTEDESVAALVNDYLTEVKRRQSPRWHRDTQRRIEEFFNVVEVARPAQVRRDDIVRWREHRF